jgi:cytochrome b
VSAAARAEGPGAIRVWDPLVRILHWSLALGVIVAYATGDDGGAWHERIGYVALAAAGLRVLWGFAGTRHARFGAFVPKPAGLARYVRELSRLREPRYVGHNPLGGVWIVGMLALVVAAGASGWALMLLGEDEYHWLEELHEGVAGTLLAAAAIHVAGVAWESLRHGENLARAMVTGRKRPPGPGDR